MFSFFSISYVWMWELDHKEDRTLKNWYLCTVVWRRLLKVSWAARRASQSILKKINPKYPLEGLMLKVKLKIQYCSHLMWRANSLEKTWCWEWLRARREEGDRGWDGWMASPTQWTWVWASSRRWWRTGKPVMLQSMGCKESDTTGQLNNNRMITYSICLSKLFH